MFFGLHFTKGQDASFINCNRPTEIQLKKVFEYCIEYKNDKLDYREALDLAQTGMKKFPYSYKLRLKKALLLESLGNSSAAEKELIGLIHLYPDRQELHNYLGRILYSQDKSKSLLALLTSISINPSNEIGKENIIFVKRLLDGVPMRDESQSSISSLKSFKVDDFDIINHQLERIPTQRNINKKGLEGRLNVFFESLSNYQHRKEGFFWRFYTPHYINIYKNNFTKDFTDYITDSQNNKNYKHVKFNFGLK